MFDFKLDKNGCICKICFYVFWILILPLKIWYKAIQNWLKFDEEWLPKAKLFGPTDEKTVRFFRKCTNLKQPYCFTKVHWSIKLKKTQLFYFIVIKSTKPFAVTKACMRWKNQERYRYHFFVVIITLLLRIFSKALMSKSDKHNYKTFTKSPPAPFLHCIENILNHSSGKCRDSLTMAALSFTMSTSLCTIFIH